jgi:hypothetical protein
MIVIDLRGGTSQNNPWYPSDKHEENNSYSGNTQPRKHYHPIEPHAKSPLIFNNLDNFQY